MRLYHATMTYKVFKMYHELFPHRKINILESFADLRKINKFMNRRSDMNSIILDSGTYTINNSSIGSDLTIRDYINYLRYNGHLYDFYFNFDDDFTVEGVEHNCINLAQMEESGLNPVPVIRDIYIELDEILDQGYPYIALASPHIATVDDLGFAMEKVKKTKTRVHLLGELDFDFLTLFPINSVDASSWTKTGAYGDILFYNPEGITDRIYLQEYMRDTKGGRATYCDYEYQDELDRYLKETFCIEYSDLLNPNKGVLYKQLINLDYFVKYEEMINRIHMEKGFATDQ